MGYLFIDFDIGFEMKNLNGQFIHNYLDEMKEISEIICNELKEMIDNPNLDYVITQKDKGRFKFMFIYFVTIFI